MTPNPFFGLDLGMGEPVEIRASPFTPERLQEIVDYCDPKRWEQVYEPILVSPAEYADTALMAALQRNFPRGWLVWRRKRL